MIPFKVYYRDGSTYVGPPENTPIFDVALILAFDRNHGRRVVSNGDFYIWESGEWLAVDWWSMVGYMARPGFGKRFLIGVMMPFEDWNEINRIAAEDPDFPPRTAAYSGKKAD